MLHRLLIVSLAALAIAGCASSPGSSPSTSGQGSVPIGSTPAQGGVPAGHGLRLITEPKDGVSALLGAIMGAHKRVDLVMYELEDQQIEAALAAAQAAGVQVRVLLNGGYYGAGSSQNQAAYSYLQAHHVQVRWTPKRFALTHQKTLVADGTAYILTFNLTPRYYSSSRDFGVIDPAAEDVSAIEAVFDADWQDQQVTPSLGAGGLVWSPGSEPAQLQMIDDAKPGSYLYVYNEEMAYTPIEAALEAASRRGVDVKVVMTDSSKWDQAFSELASAGVHVRTYTANASLYIHAKMLLTAGRGLLESENFSRTSLGSNRELGIEFTTPSLLSALGSTFTSDYAGATPYGGGAGNQAVTPVNAQGTASNGSECSASATYSTSYGDWTVDVHGPAHQTATVSDSSGHSNSWRTDSSGHAAVYFKAPQSASGETITVKVGSATCQAAL